MSSIQRTLTERYRPQALSEVIGQPKAVAQVERWISQGIGGRAYWISGPSGTGKTTLARIMARSIADDFFITEIVGRQVSSAFLDALERDSRLFAMGKGGRVWVINESHGLSKIAIERLLDILENLPAHVAIIFTTTWAGESLFEEQADAGAFASRVKAISLTNQGLTKAFAPWLQSIAQREGLDGQPVESYVKLMQRVGNNPRAALQAIENGEMVQRSG